MITLLAWIFVQVFIFGMSVWFVVDAIRVVHDCRFLALILLFFGLFGIYSVIDSIFSSGLIHLK